ncbi:MAG: hypothetical protein A2Y45_10070 [Tenericutes bacterium GWC2_34_14]|nr:MAG: hypothetical protein A2Z84_01100 [Tenericutes bacterium GWA2_35_7]OHE28921.1 MAG: hypothetical protein A2Y45_10070 [Tenericutes bacterium GWC2_34_14]OHE33868.1 MAG: hypothetical protein A2012_07140 [Tenericutes bacterium GWE2_34_108]OHE36603.1 MAG: hypothetical protein A2Y46_03950 [Tenericutes bacterium GWF1_35_14]OHE37821.1 MAG: hypothetical protein A2Y44_05330 [Tenericutes bacterium GWF2_35_184]OHE45276.1 MAG: hypothetical protein A2221_07695 [Tenericutes bacterium RIFOXYA2_FULL_36_3
MPELIISISLGLVILLVLGFGISTKQSFNKMMIKIELSELELDRILSVQRDVLVEMIKEILIHQEIPESNIQTLTILDKVEHQSSMVDRQIYTLKMTDIMDVIHAYIEKNKAILDHQKVTELHESLLESHEQLKAARRQYNAHVSYYNQKVIVFPSSLIAQWNKFYKRPFFEVDTLKKEE